MDSLNGLRYSLTNSKSETYDPYSSSSSTETLSSCQYSSAISDLKDGHFNNSDDTTSMSYGHTSGFDVHHNDYLWRGAETISSANSIPFSGYLQPNTSNYNNTFVSYTGSNGKNITINSANKKSSSTTAQSVISPGICYDHLAQTTPINSNFTMGDSQILPYPVAVMPRSESLKKKDPNINICWAPQKIPTRTSAKRNLKYLPAVSSSKKWLTNTEGSYPDCMHAKSTDLRNKGKSLNSFSNLRKNHNYPSFDFNNVRYKNVVSTKDQQGEQRSNDINANSLSECLDAGNPLLKLTTNLEMLTACSRRNISQDTITGHISLVDKEKTIKSEVAVGNKCKNLVFNPENQPILVGPPIRVTNNLDLATSSKGYSNLQRSESSRIVCNKCIWQIVDTKPQSHIKSENKINLDHENIEKPHEKGKSKSLQDLLEDGSNCSNKRKIKGEVESNNLNKDQNRLPQKNKLNDDVNEPQLVVNESCNEKTAWMEQLIEVEGNQDHTNGSHLCFGCQKPVFDRYVIQVKDHGFWHAECLKCSNCHDNLSSQKSCYVKNEQVFCRNDYNILFGLSCVKCSLQFKREQDWMRVAGQHRYHIACFLCKICKRQLGNNEKYHLVNGTDIYCTNHYRDMVNGESSDGQQPPKKAKRNRTSYTEAQIKFLQDRFLRDSNPDGNELEKIATHINLKKRVVQVWFQNNRARLKKSANNTKGGNQENKNPSMNSGVGGNSIADAMSIDWDNSLEQSSLDEHTYPNSASPSQMRPDSAHFMDTAYSLTPSFSGSLLCLPAAGSSSTTLTQEPGSLGDGSGSGTSTCGTPRDQVSPHFSDMPNSAYQGSESVGPTTVSGNDNSGNDLSGAGSNNYSGGTNNGNGCSSKGASSPNIILSALRSSVMRDKFSTSCQRRIGAREQQDQDMRNHMMVFQDQPLRHHQQPYHIDVPYGSHMGIYNNIYNMYGGYGPLNCLTGDQNAEQSDPHHSFLRIRGDQPQNSAHQGVDQSFESHYNSDGHIFSRSHIDMNTGLFSTRPPFSDTIGHVTSNGSAGTNGNSSPLSFLGANAPNPLLQSRPSSEQCAYLQGHSATSPLACGQNLNFVRSNCGSPVPPDRQNGGSYLHAMSRSGENFFVDGETA